MHATPTFTREPLGALDKESLSAIVLAMQEQNARLQDQISGLQGQVIRLDRQVALLDADNRALRDQLAQNSRNSSKPPSSDGYAKPSPKSLRAKGQRRTGGQPGHKGHTLEQVAQPDRVVVHPVERCPECQMDLGGVPVAERQRRQVFDLPPVRLEVTEHQAEIKRCPGCRHRAHGTFPDGVTQPTQYGSRLRAVAVYLNAYPLLPWKRTCDLLSALFGHRPSAALLRDAASRVVEQIAASLLSIRESLKAAPVVHADETGLRVSGKLHWLHTAGTPERTYYEVHPRRGREAMQTMGVLPAVRGYLAHDGWSPYFQWTQCAHALCNAHHLRELRFLQEEHGEAWAGELAALLCEMKEAVETARWVGVLRPEARAVWEHRYDLLLERGRAAHPPSQAPPSGRRGRTRQSKGRNLLDRLEKHKSSVLAFAHDLRVPFDNNLAERDLRMMKVKQKVSGVFRTLVGASTFCAIRSYLSTVRKHGNDALQALQDALLGNPFIPVTTSRAE